jgi:hypothetical protein
VYAAAFDAASRSGWEAEKIGQRGIRATLRRGSHVTVVLLKLDTKMISLQYESSVNLDYEKSRSGPVIHKAYMEWSSGLMSSIRSELATLCPDFTELQQTENLGKTALALRERAPLIEFPAREFELRTSAGAATGYSIREYAAFVVGSTTKCGPVSAVFYNDALEAVSKSSLEDSALLAYSDLLAYLVSQKSIAFSDAEMERMSLKIDIVTPLEALRREELLRFVDWQAQRHDRSETSKKEYEYLLAQKEAEVLERQGAIDQKEQELGLLRRQQQMQVASLDVQRQQLAAQRSMALSQALLNLSRSLTYRPAFTGTSCVSTSLGRTVYTNCN